MKTTIITLAAAIMLAGCASITGTEMRVAQEVLDTQLQVAELVICKAIPVGTWQRNYGTSPERAEGWAKLCNPPTVTPAVPALPALPALQAAVVPAKAASAP